MDKALLSLALEGLIRKGQEDAQTLTALSAAGQADGTALISQEEKIPTWRQRAYNTEDTPVGKPCRWNGQVYTLWQQHDATNQPDWSPDKAVSLWNLCHTTDPQQAKPYVAPQGARGLWQEGECCTLDGRIWKSLAANNAYSPVETPSYWEDLGSADETPS